MIKLQKTKQYKLKTIEHLKIIIFFKTMQNKNNTNIQKRQKIQCNNTELINNAKLKIRTKFENNSKLKKRCKIKKYKTVQNKLLRDKIGQNKTQDKTMQKKKRQDNILQNIITNNKTRPN